MLQNQTHQIVHSSICYYVLPKFIHECSKKLLMFFHMYISSLETRIFTLKTALARSGAQQ